MFTALLGCGTFPQVNAITESVNASFGVPVIVTGLLVTVMVTFVILGGINSISKVAETVVPFMALFFLGGSMIILFLNAEALPGAFARIFHDAFAMESVLGGAAGTTVIALMTCIRTGVARGVYTNEAGLGTAPMAHATASETVPCKQALYGIFDVFLDTIVICPLTGLTLLCGAGDQIVWGQSAGAELISASFSTVFGAQLGSMLVAVGISLFALSTILSWSYYGERCWGYLTKNKVMITIYKTAFVMITLLGATGSGTLMWDIADTLNGAMAIPNLIALLALSGVIAKITKDYFGKLKAKK